MPVSYTHLPVDSDQLSFEICAIQAYKNACAKAGPVLTEPIMKLEVVTPEENSSARKHKHSNHSSDYSTINCKPSLAEIQNTQQIIFIQIP